MLTVLGKGRRAVPKLPIAPRRVRRSVSQTQIRLVSEPTLPRLDNRSCSQTFPRRGFDLGCGVVRGKATSWFSAYLGTGLTPLPIRQATRAVRRGAGALVEWAACLARRLWGSTTSWWPLLRSMPSVPGRHNTRCWRGPLPLKIRGLPSFCSSSSAAATVALSGEGRGAPTRQRCLHSATMKASAMSVDRSWNATATVKRGCEWR